MKKLIAVLLSLTLLAGCAAVFAACGKEKGTPISGGDVDGGWTKADSPEITEEFKQVFDKAVSALTGMEYTPVAYVASQAAAGKNHCVLCRTAATVPGAEANYALVYIYEDLQGNASITGVEDGAAAPLSENDGGWTAPASPAVTEDARSALTKACETLAGVEYTPVALLATQVVSGTNYRLLCEARATVPDAETDYVILTVYADLQGGAQITDTAEFTADENAQIANPLVQYGSDMKSLEAAQEAVGFTLTVPGSLTPEDYIVINGTLLEVDFTGGYLRKAAGSGDISGDYNEYASEKTVTADGREVTLKGNDGKVMLAIWDDGDYTYCIGLDGGVSEAEVLALVNEIK